MRSRKLWPFLLVAEAAVCVLLSSLRASLSTVFSSAMAFPFEQLGTGMRALSLSGWPGNAAAFLLYAAVSLSPVAALLVLRKKRGVFPEDGLLVLLSAALFALLYLMTNPGMIGTLFGGAAGLPVGKAVLGGTVYSVLCGYLVLRVLRLFFAGSTGKLQNT